MTIPFLFPLDLTFSDITQTNIKPNLSIMAVPSSLKGSAEQISVGSSFGVGIDKNGKVHQWGVFPASFEAKLSNVPAGIGKIKLISAGLDHVIAFTEDGKIYTWGDDRMNLSSIPPETEGKNIVQMEAGHQISTALDDKGNLYVWGNENFISIIPGEYQGRIKQYALNITTALAILDDGSVVCLTNKEVPFSYVPASIGNDAFMLASTDKCVAALKNDGTAVVWGSIDYGEDNVPAEIQGHIKFITAGRNHFTAILDDGSVSSWGRNDKGQLDAPKLTGVKFVEAGYYQNYAIDTTGNVSAWGLKGYLMGSDQHGRDIALRLIYAGRLSMTVGAISVIILGIIGVLIGGISGYYGGTADMLLMRLAEIVNSIPFYPLAIILSAIIGNRLTDTGRVILIMFILGILNWPGLARLARAQILAERENEYVTAARSVGIKEFIIIFRHILPNILPVVLVTLTLSLASSILLESSLSFLGFGVREPNPTWGNMLYSCVDATVISVYWWRWVFPAIALSLSVLSINTVGDGFRDAIDPRSNDR